MKKYRTMGWIVERASARERYVRIVDFFTPSQDDKWSVGTLLRNLL
jgi:hypothetical protein